MTTSIADAGRDDRASVDKAISLLVAFGDQSSTGLGVSELARRSGLSKSTAFRVLGVLERNGVVERCGTGYRLGARLHELGRAVYGGGQERVRDALLPFLADLYEHTKHTVHLAVLHDTDVVYLAKLYGHRPVAAPSRIGGRLPAHCTAVGKALLAYNSDAATQAMSASLQRFTPNTITDPTDLAAELERVRHDGIAAEDQESRPGISCLAAPVLDPTGHAVAALSVAGRRGHIDTTRLNQVLRRIAAAASHAVIRARYAPTA